MGVFTLTLPRTGRVSAKYRGVDAGTVTLASKSWSAIGADGTLTASEKPLMKLADGTWYVIEIAMRLGKGRERHEYTVAVTPKDGERQTFTLPLGPKFRAFHWIGIHSCGDRGRYYIDDFRIVDRDPAAEQAGNQRGEGKR